MNGCVSTEQLAESVGGGLTREVSLQVDRHVAACVRCRDVRDRLMAWERWLTEEGRDVRAANPISPLQVNRMEAEARRCFRENERKQHRIREAVKKLRQVLTPACGDHLAERSIRVAASRVCEETGELTYEKWAVFIEQLRAIVGSICGITVENLVARVAARMEVEAA